MKTLLIQNAQYLPSWGGANKANRIMLEHLALRGHECHAVAVATGIMVRGSCRNYTEELKTRGIVAIQRDDKSVEFHYEGVNVIAVAVGELRAKVRESIRAIQPDVVLVSSEDPFCVLLQSALEFCVGRIVYLAHTTAMLPFGPASFVPSARGTELLRRADLVIAISSYVSEYVRTWGNINAVKIAVPLFGDGPFPNRGQVESGEVLMTNPCSVKGIDIFLDLVRTFPDTSFAAVPTWGTTPDELSLLRSKANITIREPIQDVSELLRRTKILLVPSLWDEGFGMVAVEAMLHGIPVMASTAGGLPEAKLGIEYVLPVNRIKEYRGTLNSRFLPDAIVPCQDMRPWRCALHKLLTDRAHYIDISNRSHGKASKYISGLDIGTLEQLLIEAIDGKRIVA